MNQNELALRLGQGYTPQYNSNDKGSFERLYNEQLNSLSPDLLVERYTHVNNPNAFQTSLDQAGEQAFQSFKSLFGREPNPNEFSQVMPAFAGPNGAMTGRAFLANLQQQYKANPQLDPSSEFNNQKPANVGNQVSQQFQSILGRAPTADELSHFSQAIQTGQTDAYGLGSFLKQMPEYTNAQDKTFRSSLNDELAGYDTNAFNRQKQGIISQFMQNGTYGSSALDSALADLMGQIAEKRSGYLASLSASQYGGNKDLATKNYQNTLDQMYNSNQANRQQQQAYGSQLLDRGYQGADYLTQRNDYMNFLGSQPRGGPNPIYGLIGGALGAGIGGFASPNHAQGAMAGYQIGSGLGNAGANYNYLNNY